MVVIQPCDWQESTQNYKYVVDVFGRTAEDDVVKVRLTGFSPYFYVKYDPEYTSGTLIKKLEEIANQTNRKFGNTKQVHFFNLKITVEEKLDAMNGFQGLAPIKVWKVVCPSLQMFKSAGRAADKLFTTFETDLPPYIRLFHELDLFPASPFSFEADSEPVPEDVNVDVCYSISYDEIKACPNEKIGMYLLSYDIEVYSDSGNFPVASNEKDEIIQIGMSFRYSDDMLTPHRRLVLVNRGCDKSTDPGIEFIACRDERDLLNKFRDIIHTENPDAICGYNTFGFDDGYISDRAEFLRIPMRLGRVDPNAWKDDSYQSRRYLEFEKKKFELASGTFEVRYAQMPGRLPVDLLLSVRREQNLDSYKLDNVATTFLRDKVVSVVELTGAKTQMYEIHTKSTRGLFAGNLVRFDVVTNTVNPYKEGAKFYVKEVFPKKFIVELPHANYLFADLSADDMKKLEWSFTKDDVSAQDMFASHRGTSAERAMVAKYCIQDCDLVLTLMAKLDTLVNARGMADVCRVPIQYIFLRGQGIKIYSAVVYNASKRNQVIMTQERFEGDSSYEGAIVLSPKIGMYLEQPIPVLDFNSLYPSNMIAYNLSPDTLVYVKRYNEEGKLVSMSGVDGKQYKEQGYKIDEVSYDETYNGLEVKTICGYVQPKDTQTVGILPLTLDLLLKKRKETRKLMETIEDESQKSVLNGLQLAYKVVANSVYGQCGSKTSPIRKLEVAACTTAAGRDRIQDAKRIVETEFGGQVIYGDTDSIFIKFPTTDLEESMKLGQAAAARITSWLDRRPYKIEYEKTFYPFILFCRKRYVGMMYEDDPHKCKRKSMGIALKRRDNAPIVKDVFGGALDILMEKRDIREAQNYVKDILLEIVNNKIPLEKYVVTKQLRDDYKNPDQIAHRVLADRMILRDPGNRPQVGDRIPYVYVAENAGNKKQGDRIEHYDYVKEKKLHVDTPFYITNQIQTPVSQLFALCLDEIKGYDKSKNKYYEKVYQDALEKFNGDEEEATLFVLKKKEDELTKLMFIESPEISTIVRKIGHSMVRGPMDAFLGRK